MRIFEVSCLIVDDRLNEVESLRERLESRFTAIGNAYWPNSEVSINLKFETFTANVGENADDFLDRFENKLCLGETSNDFDKRLFCIIFDYNIALLRREGSGRVELNGADFAKLARLKRPNCSRLLLSNLPLHKIRQTHGDLFLRSISKRDVTSDQSVDGVIKTILNVLAERYKTPFWDGVKSMFSTDYLVMHAMAGVGGRLSRKSVSADEFVNVVGPTFLHVEGSSTSAPLDSLLYPKTTLLEAIQSSSTAFGASFSHWVTNGTSTSNKILYQGICNKGDLVFLDQNCHISHHYGIAIAGCTPYYLTPFDTRVSGIPGGIDISQIIESLEELITNTSNNGCYKSSRLPKIISLTNCTFDGILHSPAHLISSAYELLRKYKIQNRLKEIVFLFDEAWFSFGYFHDSMIRFSAMGAFREFIYGENGNFWRENLRVYATQSLHKTAGAFRQASIILGQDPDIATRNKVNVARLCHTTTSPDLPLLASIDVARRQFELEGAELVCDALYWANAFKNLLELTITPNGHKLASFFEIASEEELLADHYGKQGYGYDPTKITLRNKRGLSGLHLKKLLWNNSSFKIQVNKFATDSILLMFMPGFSETESLFLIDGLCELVDTTFDEDMVIEKHPESVSNLTFSFGIRKFVSKTGEVFVGKDVLSGKKEVDFGHYLFNKNAVLKTFKEVKSEANTSVATEFIVPYPPGFPVILPGEIIDDEAMARVNQFSGQEIHGVHLVNNTPALNVVEL